MEAASAVGKQSAGPTLVITRWLTSRGICSRQQAKRWIAEGRVLVDSQPAAFSTLVRTDATPPGGTSDGKGGDLDPSGADHSLVQVWMSADEAAHHLRHLSAAPENATGDVANTDAQPQLKLMTISGCSVRGLATGGSVSAAGSAQEETGLTKASRRPSDAGEVEARAARLGEKELLYLLYHKPRGVECTTDPRIPSSWVNVIDRSDSSAGASAAHAFPSHAKHQLISVGRLDKDSEGLLLLTTDGSIVNPLMQSAGGYDKEYEVMVNRPFEPDGIFIERMRRGEAIRRGTVPILPPVLVEAMADQRERLSFRGESEERRLIEEDGVKYMSANQQKKLMKKRRKQESKEKRRRDHTVQLDQGGDADGGSAAVAEMDEEAEQQDEPVKRKRDEEEEMDEKAEKKHKADMERTAEGCVWFRIVLREGKNRQIRRMVRQCSDRDLIVRRLIRVRLGQLRMKDGLTLPGAWRYLNSEEVAALKKMTLPERESQETKEEEGRME